MAAEGGAIVTFVFNGENSEDIPRNVTHLIIHENITVIPARLFCHHPNLVQVYCHSGVTKIETYAFYFCRSLRRVIIPGVTIVEKYAFYECTNLMYVECDKLERIGLQAFAYCGSLISINLSSVKIVEECAFNECHAMTEAVFGKDLETIGGGAFNGCSLLERVIIPLKNGPFTKDHVFRGCVNLKRVDLVEDEALCEFADALLLVDWRSDMNGMIDSINHILPNTAAGSGDYFDYGGKAITIREWIRRVHKHVNQYKAVHREFLKVAANALQLSLPNDTVMNYVLPFIELPAHTFDWEDGAE